MLRLTIGALLIALIPLFGASQTQRSEWKQSECLHFDGNDYVDVGPIAINGARTIELWFKLDEDFTESSTTAQSLLVRNTTDCNSCDEVVLALWGSSVNQAYNGHLEFKWQEFGNVPLKIYSDTNAWIANVWHHAAAVISENDGMMLFVDGIKQQDVITTQTLAITVSDTTARIGSWGTAPNNPRYFKGNIETVRISSNARYTVNFTPNCLDTLPDSNTMSLWLFNEGVGQIAGDIGSNDINGSIVGATWVIDTICSYDGSGLNLNSLPSSTDHVTLFPNPATDIVSISHSLNQYISSYSVYDQKGRLLIFQTINEQSGNIQFNVSGISAGVYTVSVHFDDGTNENIKLIVR